MLRLLSGNTHQVYTGVTVLSPDGQAFTDHDCSNVTFCDLSDRDIHSYVSSGEPMDKAGSYALQGRAALWVTRIEGCDTSVIGLPLYLVRRLLLLAGYPLTAAQHH
jgi:septum formation protein